MVFREKKTKGINSFISERQMPSDFELVFEKPTVNIINNSQKVVYERLFRV